MAFGITWPSNTRQIIDEMRTTIGRDVTFYVRVSGIACTVCTLDPVTNLSTDSFCPGCDGNYWTDTISGWTCSAHVRWSRAGQPLWVPGGIIEEGDCRVTIAHSGNALYNAQHSEYVEVDGVDLYVKNVKLRGVPQPNRITVVLLQDKG